MLNSELAGNQLRERGKDLRMSQVVSSSCWYPAMTSHSHVILTSSHLLLSTASVQSSSAKQLSPSRPDTIYPRLSEINT